MSEQDSNMFPEWTDTWNPLGGDCIHNCVYCYRNELMVRFPKIREKYSGNPRIIQHELKNLGKGKRIFVCNMTDLFSEQVKSEDIIQIIEHTWHYPDNEYLYLTKNPERMADFVHRITAKSIIGMTFETPFYLRCISNAMGPLARYKCFTAIQYPRKVISIEPIMPFGSDFADFIIQANPLWVWIGANTCNSFQLPEPTADGVLKLIASLRDAGIKVILKKNLKRIVGDLVDWDAEGKQSKGV